MLLSVYRLSGWLSGFEGQTEVTLIAGQVVTKDEAYELWPRRCSEDIEMQGRIHLEQECASSEALCATSLPDATDLYRKAPRQESLEDVVARSESQHP